jgi:hypothetical protein
MALQATGYAFIIEDALVFGGFSEKFGQIPASYFGPLAPPPKLVTVRYISSHQTTTPPSDLVTPTITSTSLSIFPSPRAFRTMFGLCQVPLRRSGPALILSISAIVAQLGCPFPKRKKKTNATPRAIHACWCTGGPDQTRLQAPIHWWAESLMWRAM